MNEALDPIAIARQPTQQRARDRFDRILQEAEILLVEEGLSGFSIPALAERLDYTRGSVYAYFPSPYAILNELVRLYLVQLEAIFSARIQELRGLPWREGIRMVVDFAVEFHNSNPAARLLILGGAVTDDSYRAQEQTNKRLGELARQIWTGPRLPKDAPDFMTLAADIGTACFRRSFFEHGEITPAYRDAAIAAMNGFIASFMGTAADLPSTAGSTRARRRRSRK